MRDAQKPDHLSLNAIIARLKEGKFVIPDFQREFEWQPWDIKDLIRSIFLDYYIGSLLLWKGKPRNFDALSCEIIYGFEDTTEHESWKFGSGKPEYIVLDGQQRLTAIYYAFVAPNVRLPNRKSRAVYFLHVDKFMQEHYDDAFQYDWLSNRFSKILSNKERQYKEHIFPLSVIGEKGWELFTWLQGYEKYWKAEAEKSKESEDTAGEARANHFAEDAERFSSHVRGIVEDYQIAYIELDKDLEVDKVCDIFTQINSKGIRLDVFDLINALLKPKGVQLKHMWRAAAPRLEFVDTGKMNVYILQVMSILSQAYCSPKYLYYLLPGQEKTIRNPDGSFQQEILIPDTDSFSKQWDESVTAIENAISLLKHPQEFGVTSSQYLPYVSIIPVFASLQARCKLLPGAEQFNAQRKIRHWYWTSVFTNRYSGAVESTSARDFLDVVSWMEEDISEPALIHEFKTKFRGIELRKETQKGSSVYNAIFNLLVIKGARDWMTGNIPQPGDLDDHHIVPASWGARELEDNSYNSILNRSPLTSDINRNVISSRLPNEYLPELINKNGNEAVREILDSHFISAKATEILLRSPFKVEDFDAFISERQRTLQSAIENLIIKQRMGLSPEIRTLDEDVEKIELGIRAMICETFDGDKLALPSHVSRNISELIDKAALRNPALDTAKYQNLEGMLEYCDLRELEAIITSKATWSQYSDKFKNKDILKNKFNQLADLRNSIRHSRSVDLIIKKEGEAAILWFEELLV